MRLVLLIGGEPAAYGHTNAHGDFVVDEEANNWVVQPVISATQMREVCDLNDDVEVRTDDTVPYKTATLTTDRGTLHMGPGRLRFGPIP